VKRPNTSPHSHELPHRPRSERRPMLRSLTSLSTASALFLAAPLAAAWTQSSILPEAPLGVIEQSHGWHELDGRLLGGGPRYRADLGPQGVTFTPALGARVEHAQTLSLDLQSVGRSGGPSRRVDDAATPVLEGTWAVYDHGQGLRERYEARVHELEQVIELHQPLPGDGDLVLRYEMVSALVADPESSRGSALRLMRPGVGGIHIDRLWITDAEDRDLGGEMRLTEEDGQRFFEIVVPEASLAGAVYPLTVDPAFGTVIEHGGAGDNTRSDVMTMATPGVTLVTWQTQFALNDIDVRAQRLDFNGVGFGPLITVESGAGVAQRPAVAVHLASQRWVVAYERAAFFAGNRRIAARSINGATGAVSAASDLMNSTADNAAPSLGNDSEATLQSGVLMTWRRDLSIQVMGLTLDGAGLVLPGTANQLDGVLVDETAEPRISGTGGYLGHFMVVYHRATSALNPDLAILGAIVHRNGSILVPAQTSESSGLFTVGIDRTRPSVDCDPLNQFSSRFFVAFEIQESSTSTSRDVRAAILQYAGGGDLFFTASVPAFWLANTGRDEFGPAVGCATSKTYIAYSEEFAGQSYNVRVQGRNTVTGTTCESPFLLASVAGATPRDLRMRSRASVPTPTFNRSFLTWTAYDLLPPFDGSVIVQPLSTIAGTGTIQDLGGGCGGGGTVEQTIAVGPAIGDSGFGLRNLTADPLSTFSVLNLATAGSLPFSCGPCQLLPYQIMFNVPKESGGFGILLPVPCDLSLVGAQLDVQWTVFPTASSPCSLFNNISVSNIARITVGI